MNPHPKLSPKLSMSLRDQYPKLIAKGASPREALLALDEAQRQISRFGRFQIEAAGGWICGWMTKAGVVTR